MEHIADLFETSFSIDEKVEALDLLEEGWFFGNSLNRKTRMSRCNSDPCPSSNSGLEMSVKNLSGATGKLKEDDGFVPPCLVRTPSLPPYLGREVETRENKFNHSTSKLNLQRLHQNLFQTPKQLPTCIGRKKGSQEKERDGRRNTLIGQSTRRNLLRTPSLPPGIGREEITDQDRESDPRLSRSTRHPSPDLLRHKGMAQSYSLPRYRPPEVEDINSDFTKEMRRRLLPQTKLRKSKSDLESEEVQGFKDLGFTFDKDLSPNVVKILPGLQGNKPEEDLEEEDKGRRPYLSEAWFVQGSAPPVPNWAPKGSTEDMKAQIKFWARAVASNVR
ncbi:hypothetical protein F2P56_005166 [Juglans regia]|uniref:Uncharacterized protein LOC109012813 n=2 Tax=Juglans regia TaxID=51240 RepID=A0A2I4H1Z3_JUGRE|nr:uncharacterized protein LOC109012813 [Juglans regia]KAF5478623.1 hypothetical protein F2P56_005166 [Juglans regia]